MQAQKSFDARRRRARIKIRDPILCAEPPLSPSRGRRGERPGSIPRTRATAACPPQGHPRLGIHHHRPPTPPTNAANAANAFRRRIFVHSCHTRQAAPHRFFPRPTLHAACDFHMVLHFSVLSRAPRPSRLSPHLPHLMPGRSPCFFLDQHFMLLATPHDLGGGRLGFRGRHDCLTVAPSPRSRRAPSCSRLVGAGGSADALCCSRPAARERMPTRRRGHIRPRVAFRHCARTRPWTPPG